MAVRVPPPEIPIITFLSPNKADQGLIEFWNTELASYIPLDVGAPHPNSRQYPNFRLGNQRPVQGDEKWVIRTWVTDETSPDWFNYSLKFAGEDNAFPIFIRTYREPRETYTPRTKAQPLKTLYKLVLTETGSGYANGAFPSITFADSVVEPTSIAIAHAVVAPDGSITEAVLDFGGEGYEADLEFTVASPINGSPAQGIAYVQPQPAILINEQTILFPEDSPFYAKYLQVVRVYETLPGPTFTTTKIDVDGMVITVSTTRKLCSEITPGETIVSGSWCKTTGTPTDSDIVCEESIECRDVPGNPMVSVKIDRDGIPRETVRTLKDTSTITPDEVVTGGIWITTEKEAVSELVAWEVVTAREVEPTGTSNPVLSYAVDGDHEIVFKSELLKERSSITPGATEGSGNITTVEAEPVTDLIANEVTTVVEWLDKAVYSQRIPESIIPIEFRATIPTVVESHILAGTASMPTLSGSEFFVQEQQLTRLLYERRTESFGDDLDFPIEQHGQETSSEYGGAVLDVHRTLDDAALTADEGEDIVSSYVNPIGDGLMWFRETKKRPSTDAEWPINPSRLWDDNMRLMYAVTEQWVVTGTSEDPDPGGSVFAWVSEVKSKDKWHALKTNTSKPEPDYVDEASALVSYQYKPYRFPGLIYLAVGYYVRHADASLVQHKIKTWWLKSATTPTIGATGSGEDVEIDEIIMDDVVINSLNNLSSLSYSGPVLHDDLTTFGAFFYPATTPSYTQYALGTPSGTDLQSFATLWSAGTDGGYVVGDTLNINSGGFTMSIDVTAVYTVGTITGLIAGTTGVDPAGTYPAGFYGPIEASGGSGTGALFTVFAAEVVTYTPGTQWIGTYRVVGAEIKPEREKDIWRVTTESVVMR